MKSFRIIALLFSVLCLYYPAAHAEVIDYGYDAMHRLVQIDFDDTLHIEKTYDALGNKLTQTVTNGAITNSPPTIPQYTTPENSATDIAQTNIQFSWSANDPDPDNTLSFDIYLGKQSTPALFSSGIKELNYTVASLQPHTTYFWKIVAKDNHNAKTEGPVWSFTTKNSPPVAATDPYPKNGATVAYENVYLTWASNNNSTTDPVNYSLHFGTTPTPPQIATNLTESRYTVGELSENTTYYWQIITKDSLGEETAGPIWSFTTSNHALAHLTNKTYSTDTTLTKSGGPYIVSGSLYVVTGATLTIEPGTIFKMEANSRFLVNGILVANGTESEQIIFTSAKDDSYGGDTNGDGNATIPQAGDWLTLGIWHGGNGSLSHCKILFAGDRVGAISICYSNSKAIIKNITITNSNSDGILIYLTGNNSTIENNIIKNNSRNGIWVHELTTSTPKIQNNTIINNIDNGIMVTAGHSDIIDNIVKYNKNYAIKLESSISKVQNNIFNGGVYVSRNRIASFSGNTIEVNNNHENTIYANYIGGFLNDNTFVVINKNTRLNVIGGLMDKDATWEDIFIYNILETITIQGTDGEDNITTLTLNPGVKLQFNSELLLKVGDDSGLPGALVAEGTAEKPIVFTSAQKQKSPGDWKGVEIYDTSGNNSKFDYSIFEYAGGAGSGGSFWGGLNIYGSSTVIQNSIFRLGKFCGIWIGGGSPTISNSLIIDNETYGIYIEEGSINLTDTLIYNGLFAPSATFTSLSNNTFFYDNSYPVKISLNYAGMLSANNAITDVDAESYLHIEGGIIANDSTWKDLNIPYRIFSDITIQGTDGADNITTLTLKPGVELQFNTESLLKAGNPSGLPGALVAKGSAEKPIVFTSAQKQKSPGDWKGVEIYDTSGNSSKLDHCIFEYAGGAGVGNIFWGGLNIYGSSTETNNSIFRHSKYYGIWVGGGSPTISNGHITNNGTYGIYLQNGDLTVTNSSFTNNGNCAITNITPSKIIAAENNWWGDATGPLDSSDDRSTGGLYNPNGQGGCVSDYVDYEPWLNTPPRPTQKGDLNNDDMISLSDAVLGLQVIAGFNKTVSLQADINEDGKIGLAEIIFILHRVAVE